MNSMNSYENILKESLKFAKDKYPDASPKQWAAYANSKAYINTRISGGYGGPSMREHYACLTIKSDTPYAEKKLQEICFGKMTHEIARMLENEHCFNDSMEDLEEARRFL